MTKEDSDYSNTIIYKITCKSPNITDIYVGHTINFVQRKYTHKQSCCNKNAPIYKCKLYETIRNNGGWINWKMEILNFFNCADHFEARQKEQEYFELLNANLNSIEPLPKAKTKIQLVQCNNIQPESNENIIGFNSSKSDLYECKKCDYNSSRLSQYERHLQTNKHFRLTNTKAHSHEGSNYMCHNCKKTYKHQSSLCKHFKKCNNSNINGIINDFENKINNNQSFDKNLIVELLKQNQELQTHIIELTLQHH